MSDERSEFAKAQIAKVVQFIAGETKSVVLPFALDEGTVQRITTLAQATWGYDPNRRPPIG